MNSNEEDDMIHQNQNKGTPRHILTSDPKALLDAIDTYCTNRFDLSKTATSSTDKNSTNSGSNGTITADNSSNANDFSPVSFLNHHFSTESLLVTHLPSLRSSIQDQIASLDESISSNIHQQSENCAQTADDVLKAKNAIHNLHSRITLVQRKARMSERAVLEITRDMKRLDYAKKHLQKTITALKRLHMLIHAVDQLKIASDEMRYREAANLIDAVRELLKHFQNYHSSIDKMREIRDNVSNIRKELRASIFDSFKVAGGIPLEEELKKLQNKAMKPKVEAHAFGPTETEFDVTPPSPPKPKPILLPHSALAEACHVIDSLGFDVRKTFIDNFCNDHLGPYPKMFSPELVMVNSIVNSNKSFKIAGTNESVIAESPCSLDMVERRFAWLRNLIRSIDEKFEDVFPVYWQIHYQITSSFLKMTHSHFLQLLDGQYKDKDAQNVTVLLKAFQKTILFEKEMTAWLARDYKTMFAETPTKNITETLSDGEENDDVLEFDEYGNAVTASSAQGIRIKYERQMKEKKGKKKALNDENPNIPVLNTEDPMDEMPYAAYYEMKVNRPMPPLFSISSAAFYNYLDPYIKLERENMKEQITAASTDTTVGTRGELPVFISSTTLFVYMKSSINRCTALTRGKTFFTLYRAFEDLLKSYADVLSQKLPAPIQTTNIGGISLGLQSGSSGRSAAHKVSPTDEYNICHVIGTCEYCADTVEALEESIRDNMDDEFKDKIDLGPSQELFYDVTAKAIRVLVSGLETRVEGILKGIYSINWGTMDAVGEESPYVASVSEAIRPYVTRIQKLLPLSYFRSFCDKFSGGFCDAYYNIIIRQKRISESGTQQLLLDVYNLKTLILKLPVIDSTTSSTLGRDKPTTSPAIPPAMYTNLVNQNFSRIEILLKLVSTPPELLVDVFKSTWPTGTAYDFQTVMKLKDMKRAEQNALLEKSGLDRSVTTSGVVGAAFVGASSAVAASSANVSNAVTELWKGKTAGAGDGLADKVNSDFNQMKEKVENLRKQFR